jgi:hypothetical protein
LRALARAEHRHQCRQARELVDRDQLARIVGALDRDAQVVDEDLETEPIGGRERAGVERERRVERIAVDAQRFGDVSARQVVRQAVVIAMIADERGIQRVELQRALEVALEQLVELHRRIRGRRGLRGLRGHGHTADARERQHAEHLASHRPISFDVARKRASVGKSDREGNIVPCLFARRRMCSRRACLQSQLPRPAARHLEAQPDQPRVAHPRAHARIAHVLQVRLQGQPVGDRKAIAQLPDAFRT